MSRLDLAVLDHQSIALAAVVAEDGLGVEVKVEGLGEGTGWVTQEPDLC